MMVFKGVGYCSRAQFHACEPYCFDSSDVPEPQPWPGHSKVELPILCGTKRRGKWPSLDHFREMRDHASVPKFPAWSHVGANQPGPAVLNWTMTAYKLETDDAYSFQHMAVNSLGST